MGRARELKIKYGIYVVDRVNGQFTFSKDFFSSTLSFNFIVANGSASGFKNAERAALDGFSKKYQTVEVNIVGNQFLMDTSDNETEQLQGFNALASISKVLDSPWNTGHSVEFNATITWANPAVRDNTDDGFKGLRDFTVSIDYDTSRVSTLSITGEYTRYLDESSLSMYDVEFPLLLAYIKTTFHGGLVFDTVAESLNTDEEDNITTFSVVLREIIFDRPGGTPSNLIKSQSFNISQSFEAPGDADVQNSPVSRLSTISIDYSAEINQTVSRDLAAVYINDIYPFLESQATEKIQTSALALVSENKSLNYDNSTITVSLTYIAVTESNLVEYSFNIGYDYSTGLGTIPLWDSSNEFSKITFQGPSSIVCNITESANFLCNKEGVQQASNPSLTVNPFFLSPLQPEVFSYRGSDINWLQSRQTTGQVTNKMGLNGVSFYIANLTRSTQYEGYSSPGPGSQPQPPGVAPPVSGSA